MVRPIVPARQAVGSLGAPPSLPNQNILSGKIVDKTFNVGMKMEFETVDNRNLQHSYEDGDNFVFMDMFTYDQIILKTWSATETKFTVEGTDCVAPSMTAPLSVEPLAVILTVTHTGAGLAGHDSNAGTKPATVETGAGSGAAVIGEGERSKVNTTDGPTSCRELGVEGRKKHGHVPPLAKGLQTG